MLHLVKAFQCLIWVVVVQIILISSSTIFLMYLEVETRAGAVLVTALYVVTRHVTIVDLHFTFKIYALQFMAVIILTLFMEIQRSSVIGASLVGQCEHHASGVKVGSALLIGTGLFIFAQIQVQVVLVLLHHLQVLGNLHGSASESFRLNHILYVVFQRHPFGCFSCVKR